MVLSQVRRDALIERLVRAAPALIGLLAPAGFGKSVLLRQYLAVSPGRICDCGEVRDDLDLARRLLPELADQLEDGSITLAERVERAVGAWSSLTGTVAFENADRAGGAARALMQRLLSTRPPGLRVVVVSREITPISLTRYASPREVVVLRAADLAFDRSDMAGLFGEDGETVDRAYAISRGWPIAASILHRVVGEGRAGERFADLARVAFDELRDYITDDVLSAVPPRAMQALFACAAIPRATATDLRVAFGDADLIAELNGAAKDSPFIERGSHGAYVVHPLIGMMLIEHQEERRAQLLRDVAFAREEAKEFERAAEMHLARGDQHAAARALAKHEALADQRPSETYRDTLRRLDPAIVARYPRLWGMTALSRLFRTDTELLADEAESIVRTLPPDIGAMERFYVVMWRVVFASYMGANAEALDLLDAFSAGAGVEDPPSDLLGAYVTCLRAHVQARGGAYTTVEDRLNRALAIIGDVDVAASDMYLCLGADLARPRNERSLEIQFLNRALERAKASGLPNVVALVLAEMLCGAWFAGDKGSLAAAVDGLEACMRETGITGFGFLARCARGQRSEPTSFDIPSSVVYGRLIALAYTRDASERVRIADAALAAAARLGQPFLEVLAAVALGECDELRFADCQNVAREAASRCESTALSRAVAAALERRSDLGMLAPFIATIARGRNDAPAPVSLDVLAGRVRIDGDVVALSGREFELLAAIGSRREPTSRSRLGAWLWPDLSDAAARNALSVCLHRLRAHLRRDDAIARQRDGYRLHDDAVVDLWEIERSAAILRSREMLRDAERLALERTWMRLREEPPGRMETWEWFEPTRRRLNGMRTEVVHRLLSEALKRRDVSGALQLAEDALTLDACDETAYEAIIRAHQSEGDTPAAVRAFRRYRETLLAELGAEPSEALAALVGE